MEVLDPIQVVDTVPAELHYDPRDPYAITVRFHTTQGTVAWVFGRDLLLDGAFEPMGDGDVRIWPSQDMAGGAVVLLELSSPHGEALVQLRLVDVAGFLAEMTAAVEVGAESTMLDIDSTISALLTAEAA